MRTTSTKVCLPFFFAFLFSYTNVIAEPGQRLLIPRIEKAVAAKSGQIELPAFCSDISRIWPKDGSMLTNVYWGGKETILRVVLNGKNKDMTLDAALFVYHLVKLIADSRTIIIRRTNSNIKLVYIRTAGFLVGQTKEPPAISREQFIEQLPALLSYNENEHISFYMRYQQQLWRAIYEVENVNAATIEKRMQELAVMYFTKKGMQINLEPTGKIKLLDKGNNLKVVGDFYTYESVDLMQLERLGVEEYDELELCLNFNPTDSSLISFTISGKFKNVIPFEIEYSSQNKITVTSSFTKEVNLAQGISIEGGIAIEVEPKEKTAALSFPLRKCEFKASGRICYPGGLKVDVEVCGITLSMKPTSISFNNY